MRRRPLHLSYSACHGDGGIAFAVADLLHAQQYRGLFSRWLTADRYPLISRDRNLRDAVLSLNPNVIHCHGLWRSHTRIASQLAVSGLPLVIAPHGMLDPWAIAHSSWKKEIVWQLWEERSLRSAFCLHALCESEAQSIRAKISDVPIAIIPNGVELPTSRDNSHKKVLGLPWGDDIPSGEKILLFLGRYHLKKGIEPLMSAWQSVLSQAKQEGWWLVFIGFGDDNKFVSQLKTFPVERCRAYGPVFGDLKSLVYEHADAFILPSYSEGLPMAALEAMAYGLPCLLSTACNLPEAFCCGAAIESNPDPSSLVEALSNLFGMSEYSRRLTGQAGYELVKNQFSWQHVAEMTDRLYGWLQGDSGEQPSCLWSGRDCREKE
jgi:glycosyltransferase involved in cell wall biosynthesis